MLHESVHAYFDILGNGNAASVPGLATNEAAAYITGALYYLYEAKTNIAGFTEDWYVKQVFDAADAIANLLAGKSGASVPYEMLLDLRSKWARSPRRMALGTTIHTPLSSNGVPGAVP